MSQGGWTQYAVRGRSRGSQPNRFRRSGGSKQLDPTMPLGTSAHSASSAPSLSPSRSGDADNSSRLPEGRYADKESLPAKRRYSPPPYFALSQTSATPPAPKMSRFRSRSVTPNPPLCPIKRRKLDHISEFRDDNSAIILPGRHHRKSFTIRTTTLEPVIIQAEPRSLSPPQRKLVTESCSFYPLPESCKPANPDYQKNRKNFFQEKNRCLIEMGLKKTKTFVRGNDLVIEWMSNVPVWSDTLQPEIPDLATAIQLAHTTNCDIMRSNQCKTSTSSQVMTDKRPTKATSSGPSKSSCTLNPPKIKTHWASGLRPDQLELMSRLGSSASKPSVSVPRSQSQVSKTKKIALPTQRHGVLTKPISANAPTRATPVAFSPRDSKFRSRGRSLEVPDIIRTTPLAAPLVSPRPPATADLLVKSVLAQVEPNGQVRASFLNEKRQERMKEPEIERGTEDINILDADCIARELLCRTPDQHEDFEGRESAESSSARSS